MRIADRVRYSDLFLAKLPRPRRRDGLKPAEMRGHVKRTNGEFITVHWDDGRIKHYHKSSLTVAK